MKNKELEKYIKVLGAKKGDVLVFDARYVSPEQGRDVCKIVGLRGIILPDMDGIGVLRLPRRMGSTRNADK